MTKENKPFVHLLESPNAKYFFDVNANEIVYVDDDLYDVLKKLLEQSDLLVDEEKQKMAGLELRGYLSKKRVKTIKHPVTALLETYMSRKLTRIILQITQDCNLRCKYCDYTKTDNTKQRNHTSKRMSFELAKKGVDFLIMNSIDSEAINVGFYGGEPLLDFDLLKKIVNYAEQAAINKELTFSLTTNGTLVTEEMLDFFIQHDISLTISIDGPKEVHDSNRRFRSNDSGSFDKVIDTLRWINEQYPEYAKKVLINMVIDPKHSLDYILSLYKENQFLKEKMTTISSIIDDTDWIEKIIYSDKFVEEREYLEFLGMLNYYGRLDDIYVLPPVKREIQNIEDKMDRFTPSINLPDQATPSGSCIPGQLRLFMDADGNFLPCERVNELSEIMKIGNIDEGFNLDKISILLNVGGITAEDCRDCWAFTNCGLCPKQADGINELSRALKSAYCDGVKRNFEDFLHFMITLKEVRELYHESISEVSK